MKPKDVLAFAKENKVEIVDLKFVDMPGLWHHFSITTSQFDVDLFENGIGFDGSSIRGFQAINESDMLLFPDPTTAMMDPFTQVPTLSLICDIADPLTRQPYSRDPRYVARKAEKYLSDSGIADTSFWGPEIEFYIFDNVRFDQTYNQGFYYIDSEEGFWNSGDGTRPNLGYKPRYKEGYFPVAPMDHQQDIRSEMVRTLEKCGVVVEIHHHEVGTAGQAEIDLKYNTLTKMADQVLLYKYVIKNVGRRHGKAVTMMPKPIFQDNGSGMHTHQSLWKKGKNLFYDKKGYALLSDMARHYIGGLLRHAPALCGLIAPTTNSYRRLEFRTPDPSCNPYLAFPAMLMAGLDGVKNKIEPPAPVEKDLYELPPEQAKKIKSMPGSLEQALDALEKDHDLLLEGGVFTPDLIETWLDYKRKKEVDAMRLRPHPYEFALYFDI